MTAIIAIDNLRFLKQKKLILFIKKTVKAIRGDIYVDKNDPDYNLIENSRSKVDITQEDKVDDKGINKNIINDAEEKLRDMNRRERIKVQSEMELREQKVDEKNEA
jgi:hypothetical protein